MTADRRDDPTDPERDIITDPDLIFREPMRVIARRTGRLVTLAIVLNIACLATCVFVAYFVAFGLSGYRASTLSTVAANRETLMEILRQYARDAGCPQ